jgi:endonuclease YncB( thermonuclease family)
MMKNHRFQVSFWPPDQWIYARAAIKYIALILLLLAAVQASASGRRTQSGVVIYVVDGDTVWVKTRADQQTLKVRIEGIDAPEICQVGGVEAQNALKAHVLGQPVVLTSGAHDDYGRTVGTLYLQGEDVGRWLVASGHAWVYSYRHKKGPYADEFFQAQTGGRGAFGVTLAEEPRLFRKRHGSCYKNRSLSYKKTSSF